MVACGRRFGKTEVGKLTVMELALRGKQTWWLAPTYAMAGQVWRDMKTMIKPMSAIGIQISESERRLDVGSGGLIAVRSAHHPDYLRGAGLDYVVLDEAAFMEPRVWPEVVRPMLMERGGGALFLSTPFGRNWFWELYKIGLDPDEPDWASFHFTSLDNPLIPRAEFEAIRRVTPQRIWREEYLAEFIEDAGQVFRGLETVATASSGSRPRVGGRYVAGVDWGREGDYTVIVVLDADERRMVAYDRFNTIGWAFQRGRLKALCDYWQPEVIWAEANSAGSVNIEALQAEGLPMRAFTTTARTKPMLIEQLALAIERGELSILRDRTLLDELAAYTLERLPGGGYRYGAPPGQHDDCVMALALAWYAIQHSGVSFDFV